MLAFWKHGLKGKSFHSDEVISYKICQTGTELLSCVCHYVKFIFVPCVQKGEFHLFLQVTQEITDESRVFRVLGTNRYVDTNLTISESVTGESVEPTAVTIVSILCPKSVWVSETEVCRLCRYITNLLFFSHNKKIYQSARWI